ncbi:MAG: 3-oxoacyl-[acyl-carrier-protein] reductase [Alphaproteobacteria bacterium]|nr:3-oxoacyl-[acyl-carrier-protein] reductase [Alphaproteobacteria bacterium]
MCTLTGLKAVVTGATRGIGKAIAEKLSAQGVELVIAARNKEALDTLVLQLPTKAHAIVCDLSNPQDIDHLAQEAEKLLGQVDILVNNAGITADNLLMRMKDDEWDRVINTNLTSVFKLTRALLRGMMRKKWGRIINISSIVGVTGNAGQANYVASKAGLIGFSKSLALEVASRSITVNCVAPGFIETDMTTGLTDEQKEKILGQIPQGTMGTPEDIAYAVLYLASKEASYVTGQVLHVNGGMV